ncbi:MAG: HhH-GPD-type base excision DNA repair protein [Propionicimonas sp.]|nr:HhH-GPD-type base excision DNA repair protein [Propionicimonas sp.]
MPDLHLTGDPVADQLLSTDPNALLIGMLLDQQVTMEKAFTGPAVIASRMGGRLDVAAIAAAEPEEFIALCSQPPAVHRFPRAMAERVQDLCRILVDDWQGSASHLFAAAATGEELRRLLGTLPGFGAVKAQIFLALLGKQYGITPPGWREAAGDFGLDGFRSVADITDRESLLKVRATKQAVKAAARAAKQA